jgi:hypothetical protein
VAGVAGKALHLEPRVWLVFYKAHTGVKSIRYEDTVREAATGRSAPTGLHRQRAEGTFQRVGWFLAGC